MSRPDAMDWHAHPTTHSRSLPVWSVPSELASAAVCMYRYTVEWTQSVHALQVYIHVPAAYVC